MLLDAVLLRSFVAVCESHSFTKAAKAVHLTQSAISLHIKRLEEQVGRRLFDRSAHRVSLTPDGEILLTYARRILALHEEAQDQLRRADLRGRVRFGAPEYFDPQMLSALLVQFTRRYPAISLEIDMAIGPDIAARLDAGELDVAIVNREIDEGDGVLLWRDSRVWVCGPDLTLSADAPVPLALYPSNCVWRRIAMDALARVGRSWRIVLQSAGTAGIAAAVESGLAVSIYPGNGLTPSLRALGLEEGMPPLPDFEYVVRRRPDASAAAARLAEVIADCFRIPDALRPKSSVSDDTKPAAGSA